MKFQDKLYDIIDNIKCPSSEKSAEKCILRSSYFHHSEPSYGLKCLLFTGLEASPAFLKIFSHDTSGGLFDSTASSDVKSEASNKNDSVTENLYDRNLTVVNMTNFKFIINDDICDVQNLSLVTIIHSATQNSETRDIIR